MVAVRRTGGTAVVQHPADALFCDMPNNALETAGADHVVPIREMGALLARLVGEPDGSAMSRNTRRRAPRGDGAKGGKAESGARAPSGRARELGAIARINGTTKGPAAKLVLARGKSSGFTCPGCGGSLWETAVSGLESFQCHVGHQFSIESLTADQWEVVEQALWAALRALQESAVLSRRLEERANERGRTKSGERFAKQAEESEARAAVLRELLHGTLTLVRPGKRRRKPRPGAAVTS